MLSVAWQGLDRTGWKQEGAASLSRSSENSLGGCKVGAGEAVVTMRDTEMRQKEVGERPAAGRGPQQGMGHEFHGRPWPGQHSLWWLEHAHSSQWACLPLRCNLLPVVCNCLHCPQIFVGRTTGHGWVRTAETGVQSQLGAGNSGEGSYSANGRWRDRLEPHGDIGGPSTAHGMGA